MEKHLSILGCRNAGERMMELSGIPASWAWVKALHFVYTIVIPSTSCDRSLVIHFGGVFTDLHCLRPWPIFSKEFSRTC